ncbi:unnamed protein product [Lymnaea stagnalis]|uniref:Peptidase S1 domain-containing protein n=1 Tax=Lymnaea stagnalis TaxID=6523 RepID=A0AAV2HAW5_LYMST
MRIFSVLVLLWGLAHGHPARRGVDLAQISRSRYDKIDAPGCGQRPLAPGNGVSELVSRIMGGKESIPYSWPAMCSFRTTDAPDQHKCGGNLVRNLAGQYYLITTAHCVPDPKASLYEAHCGIHDRADSSEPNRVILYFNHAAVHANHNPWTYDYDIAVLRVITSVTTSNYISAVCIPNEGWYPNNSAIAVGWGSLGSAGVSPYKLHQVTKPIKSRPVCEERYGSASITLRMLCAGLPEGGVDSCEGDSGGPLYTYIENRWTLTGLSSWGYGCGIAGRPGVYADIIELKDWINLQINV